MSETNANAYRLEASEKRKAAADLLSSAKSLEAQAEELDPSPKKAEAPRERDSKGHFLKEPK